MPCGFNIWEKMVGSCTGETLEINSHETGSSPSHSDPETAIITSAEATMLNHDNSKANDTFMSKTMESICTRRKSNYAW